MYRQVFESMLEETINRIHNMQYTTSLPAVLSLYLNSIQLVVSNNIASVLPVDLYFKLEIDICNNTHNIRNMTKQTGAELCQAQVKLG